ncbi:MAG: hypothetical protein QOD84_278 [Acidobacteriaceae bacterium]|jgi:predicted GNAT family acetyltransferase
MLPDLAASALDNPIWAALTSEQKYLSQTSELARRFPAEVTPLAGFAEPSKEAYRSLLNLVRPEETVALFLREPPESSDAWFVKLTPLLQMVDADKSSAEPTSDPPKYELIKLGAADSPEMLALAQLTKPGPFGTRTHELGEYFGIRVDGALVAMAGERLHFTGHTEVSAVCTHPNHLGRGHAGALVAKVVSSIRQRGEVAILHVRADNARAIGVYERLGFKPRLEYHVVVMERK